MDGAFSEVALPYMNIPRVLAELHRVLVPGGWLRATLHAPSFTWGELKMCFPRPRQTLFRVFVLLNGMVLHCCGGVISVGKMVESCQTDAGMRTALGRAGFTAVSLHHEGPRFYMEARRDGARAGGATAAVA